MRGEEVPDAAGGVGDGVLAARRGPALERRGRLLAQALVVAPVAARMRLTEVPAGSRFTWSTFTPAPERLVRI